MPEILNQLQPSPRELSILIWCFIGSAFFLKYKSVRKSFPPLLKSFFNPKMQIMIWVSIAWIFFGCFLMWRNGYWDITLLKETIIWTVTAGIAFTFRAISQKGDTLSQIFLDNLKISALLSFFVNLYSFELWIELIIFPIMTFVLIMDAVAQVKKELKDSRTITSRLAVFFASLYVLSSAYLFFTNITKEQMFYESFKVFLPVVLYIICLPLFYFWSMVSMYENLFIIFYSKPFRERPGLANMAKWKIIKACHLNPFKLKFLMKNALFRARVIDAKNIEDIDIVIRQALVGKLEAVDF